MNKSDKSNMKAQAKKLLVEDGLSIEETAIKIGVTTRSISKWREAGRWEIRLKQELRKRRQKAWYLIVVKGLQQKEVASILGVSEKSICNWSKDGEWQEDIKHNLSPVRGVKDFIGLFFMYLFALEPGVKDVVRKRWNEYLKAEEKEIDL